MCFGRRVAAASFCAAPGRARPARARGFGGEAAAAYGRDRWDEAGSGAPDVAIDATLVAVSVGSVEVVEGAAEMVDYPAMSVTDTVRSAHPDGIDALIDVASDADQFAELSSLVRSGGSAVTT